MAAEGRTFNFTASGAVIIFGGSFSLCDNAGGNCGDLTISASAIGFSGDDANPFVIDAGAISLTASMSGDFAIANNDNENVTLNARAGDLTISTQSFDMSDRATGLTTLTLSASGKIDFPRAGGTTLAVAGIVLDAATITAAGALDIDTSFNSGALTFMRDTTITGSGAVTLESRAAQDSSNNPNVNISAVGNLTLGGNFNLGEGALTLTYSGTLGGTPTVTTPNLSITRSSFGILSYASWMQATGRNLTLTASNVIDSIGTINLGTGDLTLNANFIELVAGTITAGDITMTARNTSDNEDSGIINESGSLTVNASGDITISSTHIDFGGASAANALTLSVAAGKAILFTKDTTISDVFNLTLGGTIKAENADGSTKYNLTVRNSSIGANTITFAGDTDISGANISLNSTNAQTDGGNSSVTITATARAAVAEVAATASTPAIAAITAADGNITLTGAFDLGTGSLTLDYVGSLNGTPTLRSPNLSITNSNTGSDSFIIYASWMQADGRNLTLTATSGDIFSIGNINLGTGNLTLEGGTVALAVSGPFVITAGDVTITARATAGGDEAGFQSSSASLTLNASGDITISSTHIDFGGASTTNTLTLSVAAGKAILFTKDTTISDAFNLTLGGTVKAENADGSIQYDLTVRNSSNTTNTITFAGVTEISGADISLESTTAQTTASNADLTITALGVDKNVTLTGAFNIGGGDMRVSATGDVLFAATRPTLTAASFFLTWGGTRDYSNTRPANFQNADGDDVIPAVDAENQTEADWFALPATRLGEANADVDFRNDGITLDIDGVSTTFSVINGVLDFGEHDILVETTANIIFPAGITSILANNLTLIAANIGIGDSATPLTSALTINYS